MDEGHSHTILWHGSGYAIAYLERRPHTRYIVAMFALLYPNGLIVTEPRRVSNFGPHDPGFALNPCMAASGSGYIVAWNSYYDGDLYATLLDAAGVVTFEEFVVRHRWAAMNIDYHPSAAWSRAGGALRVLAWRDERSGYRQSQIFARRVRDRRQPRRRARDRGQGGWLRIEPVARRFGRLDRARLGRVPGRGPGDLLRHPAPGLRGAGERRGPPEHDASRHFNAAADRVDRRGNGVFWSDDRATEGLLDAWFQRVSAGAVPVGSNLQLTYGASAEWCGAAFATRGYLALVPRAAAGAAARVRGTGTPALPRGAQRLRHLRNEPRPDLAPGRRHVHGYRVLRRVPRRLRSLAERAARGSATRACRRRRRTSTTCGRSTRRST